MTVAQVEKPDLAYDEWHRLNLIAEKFESRMRLAYTRAMIGGVEIDKLKLHKVITDILIETCVTSSHEYGIVFTPNSPIYLDTIDRLVEKYAGIINVKKAREAVRKILPPDIQLQDMRRRLNTFGLDTLSAVKVERYRQERYQQGTGPSADADIERVRHNLIQLRGNLLATTETNRAINTSLEALWLDNANISKAEVLFYDRSINDIANLPKRARKVIVTRRDDRVCDYCDPLDGISAKIGKQFDTEYGLFDTPPFHPRCRCFMLIGIIQ